MFKELFMRLSASVGIIGGTDGPTEIIVSDTVNKGLQFTTEHLGDALVKSVAGMIGIFIVIGIIIFAVTILSKAGNKKN